MTADNTWATRPGPQMVEDDLKRTGYINDYNGPLEDPTVNVVASGVESGAPKARTDYGNLLRKSPAQQAVWWPKYAWESECAMPFVAAGVTGAFVAPMIMPEGALTGFLLGGYVVGSAVWYLKAQTKLDKAQTMALSGFIAEQSRKASDNVSSQMNRPLSERLDPQIELYQQIQSQLIAAP